MSSNSRDEKGTLVEIVEDQAERGTRWRPEVGEESQSVIENHVPAPSRDTVRREAVAILGKCLPPTVESGTRTGLVLGRIQSGKTLSFTVVSALARDNDYRLVVVITGTRKDLFHQSNERLKKHLGTDSLGEWEHYRSDNLHTGVRSNIQSTLDSWDEDTPISGLDQTVLITVMKERHHLEYVNRLLSKLDLEGVPSLVIDDEADRAGLNTNVGGNNDSGERSATNRRLMRLRGELPHHSYLQYTATPQALLLLNLIDSLSPDFAQVLTPGDSYTGGEAFFEGEQSLVRPIPIHEIPEDEAPAEMPVSLEEAMRIFFVGAASELLLGKKDVNRSMMVHPARLTEIHYTYYRWVASVKSRWKAELGGTGKERRQCVEEFREAYEDLSRTVDNLPPFEEVVEVVPFVIDKTVVLEINSANREGIEKSKPNWDTHRWHILVGGDKLDRGVTVKGLTVSYMSRQRGVGNADTIQQRARWFGYKEDYLGFCRVFLPQETIIDYINLVEHENSIRQQIERLAKSDVPVREWRTRFLLDGALKPTRRSVVQNEMRSGRFENEWVYVRSPHKPHGKQVLEDNRGVIEGFREKVDVEEDEGDERRRESHRHQVARQCSLEFVYEELLTEYQARSATDLPRYTGALMQVGHFLDSKEGATCSVYFMRAQAEGEFERGLDDAGRIKDLFQGAYPDADGEIYPGDRKIIDGKSDLTVQVHMLDRLVSPGGKVVATDVPVLAMRIGQNMGGDWVVGYDPTA